MAKYYGVKQGIKPGVYTTWPECQEQVKGYKGALYKSFSTEEEAKTYVYGDMKQTINTTVTGKDIENIKWELHGIREGLKERDIPFILDKVNTIAEILKIELDPDSLSEYAR